MDSTEVQKKIDEIQAKVAVMLVDGRKTSEYFLAKIVIVLGVVVGMLPQIGDVLGMAGRIFPQSETVKSALVILAALTPLLTSLLYTVSRWKVKVAVLNAIAVTPVPAVDAAKAELLK